MWDHSGEYSVQYLENIGLVLARGESDWLSGSLLFSRVINFNTVLLYVRKLTVGNIRRIHSHSRIQITAMAVTLVYQTNV